MGRLPTAVPKTISVGDQLRRSACTPDMRRQASDLLLALAAVECHVSADGPTRVPPALLRDLVIITASLAGRTWLEARTDSMAAFTELQAAWQPPPLPELDDILAGGAVGPVRPAPAGGSSIRGGELA